MLGLTDLVLISLVLGIPGIVVIALAVALIVSRKKANEPGQTLLPPAAASPNAPPTSGAGGEWGTDDEAPST